MSEIHVDDQAFNHRMGGVMQPERGGRARTQELGSLEPCAAIPSLMVDTREKRHALDPMSSSYPPQTFQHMGVAS